MAEDIAQVGPRWKQRVDSGDEFAIVLKVTLAEFAPAPGRGTDAHEVMAALAVLFEHTREMYDVASAPIREILVAATRIHAT